MSNQTAPVIGIAYSDCAARDNEMRIRTYVSRKYYHAIQQSGGIAVLLPAPYISPKLSEFEIDCLHAEHINTYMNMVDGIIFAGGEDIDPKYQGEDPIPELGQINPFRDAFEIALAKAAKTKKILICSEFVVASNYWRLLWAEKSVRIFQNRKSAAFAKIAKMVCFT